MLGVVRQNLWLGLWLKEEREGGRERERARERRHQAQAVVAGEKGTCSLPEVGGCVRSARTLLAPAMNVSTHWTIEAFLERLGSESSTDSTVGNAEGI